MLRFLTAGESHGPQLTAIVDGLPAGLTIDPDHINLHLSRRQKGYGRGGRMKIENDHVDFVSGVRHGRTMGGPVTLIIRNRDWDNWAEIMHPFNPIPEALPARKRRLAHDTSCPRPGHADLPGGIKWHHHDLRNVLERASARETAARVAAGSLVRQVLEHFGVQIASHVVRIGPASVTRKYDLSNLAEVTRTTDESPVRCLDKQVESAMVESIREAKKQRDSLGGIAEVIVRGLPVGLGSMSQWFERLDSRLAGALMSIPSAKGVEIGLGFGAARLRGSRVHDEIFADGAGSLTRKGYVRKTNRAGGLEGGISNGEDIVVRVAFKPISTLNRPLRSVDVRTREPREAMVERADTCVVPAAAVISEAVCALVLGDAFLDKFGADSLVETERNYWSYLEMEY